MISRKKKIGIRKQIPVISDDVIMNTFQPSRYDLCIYIIQDRNFGKMRTFWLTTNNFEMGQSSKQSRH